MTWQHWHTVIACWQRQKIRRVQVRKDLFLDLLAAQQQYADERGQPFYGGRAFVFMGWDMDGRDTIEVACRAAR